MSDRRQPRAAAFDKADAHLPVLARSMQRRAAATLAPGGDDRIHVRPAEAALGQCIGHLRALPGKIGVLAPMLQLTAPAPAKMPARRRLAFGTRAQHLQHLGASACHARAHLLARQSVGRVEGCAIASGQRVAAPAHGGQLQHALLGGGRASGGARLMRAGPGEAIDALHVPFRLILLSCAPSDRSRPCEVKF
ncbi:MAG: hypothetical protein R3C25_03480 [Hyphomonadaceae bacterium]